MSAIEVLIGGDSGKCLSGVDETRSLIIMRLLRKTPETGVNYPLWRVKKIANNKYLVEVLEDRVLPDDNGDDVFYTSKLAFRVYVSEMSLRKLMA